MMISHKKRICYHLFFVLCLCSLAACNKGVQVTESVEGIVTLDDVPLEGAGITFIPKASDGTVAGGYSTDGGRYTVQTIHGEPGKGTTPGEYFVTVKKIESVPSGRKTKNDDGETIDEMMERSIVPTIYGSQATTPISATVVPGKNTINIQLNSSAK